MEQKLDLLTPGLISRMEQLLFDMELSLYEKGELDLYEVWLP